MKNKQAKAKIFLLKNLHQRPAHPYMDSQSDSKLSSFQSLYLNTKQSNRRKDVSHLSTLIQRDNKLTYDQRSIYSKQKQIYAQQNDNFTKDLLNDLKIQSNIRRKDKKQQQQLLKIDSEHKKKYSNQKILEKIHYFGSSKRKDQFQNNQACNILSLENILSTEDKFYSLNLEKNTSQQKSLAYIFRQKWNQKKLKSKLQKTERIFKNAFNSLNYKRSQIEKFNQIQRKKSDHSKIISKRLLSQQEEYLRQTKRGFKQSFLKFVDKNAENNEKYSNNYSKQSKQKLRQKILSEEKFAVFQNHKQQQNRSFSVKKFNNKNKIKIVTSKHQTFNIIEPIYRQRISSSQDCKSNKNHSHEKKYTPVKRKNFFMSTSGKQRNWWSKQQITEKSGQKFNLKNTMIS